MSNAATNHSGSLFGKELIINNETERRAVLDAAFDYRGDVTLHLQSGGEVEGYLFNRDNGLVQIFIKGSDQPRKIQDGEILKIVFTGKDPADGKSYENWKSKKEAERKVEADQVASELRQQGYL